MSSDFAGLVTLEPSALVRWYVPVLGGEGKGLFVQGNVGASLIFEEGEPTPAFLGALRPGTGLCSAPGLSNPLPGAAIPFYGERA
ncbi:hypothetical protein K7I13_05650 [Brucepastera parasyntrophica]|uniref:hypothetical protein n=1 Tax=Brucepastera parasyntrophica TaxID=2880008 RepID=UPI0021090347|nr:hypothetical protein [Brucepastera parasyntrophica]ULQ60753.1 hypothetical protein K7I13_05650 [Brucepastera parasyntrophica]